MVLMLRLLLNHLNIQLLSPIRDASRNFLPILGRSQFLSVAAIVDGFIEGGTKGLDNGDALYLTGIEFYVLFFSVVRHLR